MALRWWCDFRDRVFLKHKSRMTDVCCVFRFLRGSLDWALDLLQCLVPLFQRESKCETILMKMSLICIKMKLHAELIFIWKVSHLDSFWNRGTRDSEMAYWRHNYHNLMNSTRRRRVDSDSMAENWPNASHSNQLWIYLHSKEGSKDGAVARGFAPYQVQWPVEFSGFCSLHKNQHLQIPILPRRRTVQPPKWSRPRKDPQPWNDPQIDPEMIPTPKWSPLFFLSTTKWSPRN